MKRQRTSTKSDGNPRPAKAHRKRTGCQEDGCTCLRPSFNLPTERKGLFCKEHKKDDMINVVSKRCQDDGCNAGPSFNLPTETNPRPAKKRRQATGCQEDGCTCLRPSFNLSTETKGLYCKKHKKEDMINVTRQRCQEDGCTSITPAFNLPTETRGLFCKDHKKEGMIDVKSKRCQEDGCNSVSPSFNLPTETKGLFCKEHKKEDMINVVSKRCQDDGCPSIGPCFNMPTERQGVYCKEHKKEGMIDVSSKRCQEDGCPCIGPSFNLPTETKGLFCKEHKKEGMISVRAKKCGKCKNKALYGKSGKRAQFCVDHTEIHMVNVILEGKCSVLDCEAEHDVMVDGIQYCLKHCPHEQCAIALKRLCKYCDIKEKSTHVCKECRKISCKKEWGIVRYLRKAIDTKFEYNSSRMLQGCSKKRPDIYFEQSTHCVIVEIDEHQHRAYDDTCECARINEIVNGIGGRPVIIIRFNPDATRAAGKLLPLTLRDKLDLLVATIKEELTSEYHVFMVKLVQLYFDDPLAALTAGGGQYEARKDADITAVVCV